MTAEAHIASRIDAAAAGKPSLRQSGSVGLAPQAPHRPWSYHLNHVLAALPAPDLERVQPHLRPILLPAGTVLFEAGRAPTRCTFLNRGLVSLMLPTGEHEVEVALLGREALIGGGGALMVPVDSHRAVVQISGAGWQLPIEVLRQECARQSRLQQLLVAQAQHLLAQSSRIALCASLHSLEARLCAWLLVAQDRVDTHDLKITHVDIAHALGVRRAGVTVAANALRKANLIDCSRGHTRLLDRPGLEARACRCYHSQRRLLQDVTCATEPEYYSRVTGRAA